MIETRLLDYLSAELSVFVGYEAPSKRDGYVLIDKTGSSRTNHIITSTFAIQSYGKTLLDAMILKDEVERVMEGFIEDSQIVKVELETDYNFTDTETKQYRWQSVYDITHY